VNPKGTELRGELALTRPSLPFLRLSLITLLAGVVALVAGAVVAAQPKLALGAAAAAVVFVLAFRAPVANLVLLIFLTAIVPFEILNRFSVGGGVDSPGLLFSDLFLLAGLTWAAFTLASEPLDRRRYRSVLVMLIFLAIVVIEVLHGLKLGYGRSIVGQEGRVLLGLGTFLIALPLVSHAATRSRLFAALAVVAFALGAWGMLQWLGHFSFGLAGDVGVRSGVRLTSGGSGQLQGGAFAFPVAIIVCFAALTLGEIRSWFWRGLLVAALALNIASCIVTFERSFWLDTLAGLLFVLVFAAGRRRVKLVMTLLVAGTVTIAALAVITPSTLTTAQQRLNSISSYSSDDSVRYRVVESRFVYDRIRAHPLTGSGLGASIFWGQPWAQVPPKTRHYSHDGYFWLAWKVGVPAAALLVGLLVSALFSRSSPAEPELSRAVRRGAQGAIAGLLVATITFPSFSQLSIAPVIGLLLALALAPSLVPRPRRPLTQQAARLRLIES
jgi:O-antigen ligase